MSIFLSQEEISELTECEKPSKQSDWFTARGWVFERSRLGRVKVLRRYAEMRLGLLIDNAESQSTEPDFSKL